MNAEVRNRKQREYREKNGNLSTRLYEKTEKGFLVRLYRNMQSRVEGVQKEKHHLYKGKSLLDRNSFYEWALSSSIYRTLFLDWESSGYDRKLTPSVDRVDSSFGYEIPNMEWVTHSENSRRGSLSRHHGENV